MGFDFIKGNTAIAYFEKVCGSNVGLKLPLHEGVNFIGRDESRCEYTNLKKLSGIIEGAQIYIKIENKNVYIADATSTNQSFIFNKNILLESSWKELNHHKEKSTQVQYERYETKISDRTWYKIKEEDIIFHLYGCWVISLI